MKKHVILVLLFSMVFSAELPWDKISIGTKSRSFINISDLTANSLTFYRNNLIYGLDAVTIAGSIDGGIENPEQSMRVIVFMPRFGYNHFLRSNERLSSSYSAEFLLVLPYVSIDTGDKEANDELEDSGLVDTAKDIIDMAGVKFSYIVEYKFNRQLGLSTEFGFNYLLNNIELDQQDGNIDISARIGNTYSQISLTYYW